LAHSSTLTMEATCSSETLVDFQRTTWRYIPENRTIYNHRYENLKSSKFNRSRQRTSRDRTYGSTVMAWPLCIHVMHWVQINRNTIRAQPA
jgi:hypothetical protein